MCAGLGRPIACAAAAHPRGVRKPGCTLEQSCEVVSSLLYVAMADLEAVFTDISYIMAIEKSRNQTISRCSRNIVLPDAR